MRRSATLALYGAAMTALSPLAPAYLRWRAGKGKEEAARLGERLARPDIVRPEGRLVWMHGASIGETRVNLTLANALAAARPELNFLITTHTRTGADAARRAMPARGVHQYAPLDAPGIARRFIDHWRPDLAVFAESELWPSLIGAAARQGVTLALVNARMSQSSLARWARRAPRAAAQLLSRFAWIGAADSATSEGLEALSGRAAPRIGNVKLDAPPPGADAQALAALRAQIGARPVWCAASTHEGEEATILRAHQALRHGAPDALLILAPRHPERGEAVEMLVREPGLTVARRSRGEPVTERTDVYLADTTGEMGVLLRAAPVALLGGSLVPGVGGHNPGEPIGAGACVLTGPHTFNFAEIYAELAARGGAAMVGDENAIALRLAALLHDADERARMRAAAESVVAESGGAAARTVQALLRLLDGAPA